MHKTVKHHVQQHQPLLMHLIKSFGSSSAGNSILVGDILLDAGISPSKIKPKPKAVLITHRHGDHMKYAKAWQKRGITCYSGEHEQGAFAKLVDVWDRFTIHGVEVEAVPALHDTENTLNFILEFDGNKVLYEVDNAKRIYEVEGITHYIAECNWDETSLQESINDGRVAPFEEGRLRATHKSLEILLEELETMDKSKLKEVWLAHCSDRNLNKELAKRAVQEKVGVPVYFA